MTNREAVRTQIRTDYGKIAAAREGSGCSCGCSGSGLGPDQISRHLGYTDHDLASVPQGANLGLGCGSPGTLAGIKEGETIVDLGSGAGFDCFLAAQKVGPSGRVIGVDMTPEMVARARQNQEKIKGENISFRLGEIEHLPVGDLTADLVISNCVVNLSPEKESVFKEAYRILKPGGRLSISDILALKPLPSKLKQDLAMVSACIGGAATVEKTKSLLESAGFTQVSISIRKLPADIANALLSESNVEDYVAPADITAVKAA